MILIGMLKLLAVVILIIWMLECILIWRDRNGVE
jgi:hypothetical protein